MNLMSQKTLPALTYDWLKKFKSVSLLTSPVVESIRI